MSAPGGLVRLALRLVPEGWRESVARDLADEAARDRRRGVFRDLWMGWQTLRVAARFAREQRQRGRSIAGQPAAWNLAVDARLAWRSLKREPSATLAVVFTLALGTGAATATYAVVNYALLRPVPGVRDESRLISVYPQVARETPWRTSISHAHLVAMRDQAPALAGLASWSAGELPFTVDPALSPSMVSIVTVSQGYFEVVGVQPRLGRLFTPDEYESTGAEVLVISERLWRREFNTDPAIVGRRVRLGGHTFDIIGVARHFQGLDRLSHHDGWLTAASRRTFAPSEVRTGREAEHLSMVGRLAPGAALETAQAQLTAAFTAAGEWKLGDNTFWPFAFPGLHDGVGLTRTRIEAIFRVMLSGVALLLVLACANAANLMLARHLRRRADLLVRHALGASRIRLVRELLVEAGAIALAAGTLGLGLAQVLATLFRSSRLLSYLPALDDLAIDWRVAVFCAAVSGAAIALFALGPAWLASRAAMTAGVATGTRTTRPAGWFRTSLVGTQVALSFILVVAAALLAQTVHRLHAIDFGFRPDEVLRFSFRPSTASSEDAAIQATFQALLDRLRGRPGIAGSALSFLSPFSGGSGGALRLPEQDETRATRIVSHYVTPDYFSVLGVPLLQGRTFTDAEAFGPRSEGAPIILNAALARAIFGSEQVVGRLVLSRARTSRGQAWISRPVIGLAGSVVGRDVREGHQPFAYEPFGRSRIATVLVRPAGPIGHTIDEIRRAARDAAPAVPVDSIAPLRTEADEEIAQERVLSRLSVVVGVIAGVLALSGLYGAVTQFVGERTREFAIRKAIGATSGGIARAVLRRAAFVTGAGLAAGCALMLALTGLIATYLYGVSPRDPVTIAVVAAGLAAASIAAAWPAVRRATRVDPAVALRAD